MRLIQEARGRRQTGEVRRLKCPEIDVTATHYAELTDLESYAERVDIELPCTRLLSDADLCALMEQPYQTHVPCHTQSTERAVELTSESAAAVSGADRQDGYSHRRDSHNKVIYRQRFCQKYSRRRVPTVVVVVKPNRETAVRGWTCVYKLLYRAS